MGMRDIADRFLGNGIFSKILPGKSIVALLINGVSKAIGVYNNLPSPLKVIGMMILGPIMPLMYFFTLIPKMHQFLGNGGVGGVIGKVGETLGFSGLSIEGGILVENLSAIYNYLQGPLALTVILTVFIPLRLFRIVFRAIKAWVPTVSG